MKSLKDKLGHWTLALWAILKPLGLWGVFLIAAEDSAAIALPVDAAVAGYVFSDPSRMLLYAAMAALGSGLGSMVIYAIGYKGGEVLLRSKMAPERFEKIRRQFDEHEFWTLMFPAMLPPPFPFKVVALAASVFEMKPWRYFGAIALGRFLRYLLVGFLATRFGPDAIKMFGTFVVQHIAWLTIALEVGIPLGGLLWVVWRKRKKAQEAATAENGQSEPAE